MDKRILAFISAGTGNLFDPLKPQRMNTVKAKVGNAAAAFDKIIKKYPAGFSIDKTMFFAYLNKEKLTAYTRSLFKRYGYKIHIYKKKPIVYVTRYESISDERQPAAKHFFRHTDKPMVESDGNEARSDSGRKAAEAGEESEDDELYDDPGGSGSDTINGY
jgi:hypothetical protein